MRIAVAMSGGVDSSVAAHILKEEGHEVVGLTMRIWPCGSGDAPEEDDARTCCSPGAVREAERVAEQLGIRHYTLGMRGAFERAVVQDFLVEYSEGRTPNPCVVCNRTIKFGPFLAKAAALGASHLATGHHAVIRGAPGAGPGDAGFELRMGADRSKDQSYFLYVLSQDVLSRTLMPVGPLGKAAVRDIARSAGLTVADRAESQDVCFVPGGDVESFFRMMIPGAMRPGPIEDVDGNVLGEHRGLPLYTVGQRSGLGLARPRPTYVLKLDAERNALIVGEDDALFSSKLTARDLNWIAGVPPSGEFRASARIRHAADPAPCGARVNEEALSVTFDEPQRAVAPGQSVVLYDGERVLGGGRIAA